MIFLFELEMTTGNDGFLVLGGGGGVPTNKEENMVFIHLSSSGKYTYIGLHVVTYIHVWYTCMIE